MERKGRKNAGVWQETSLRLILRDKAMLGHVVHNGESVLGDDGMPLIRAEPLIDPGDWDKLQAQLDKTSLSDRQKHDPSMLLNVAYCGRCGSPLYKWSKANAKGTVYSYYRCRHAYTWRAGDSKTCDAKLINAAELDDTVNELVMAIGHQPHTERHVIPGDNYDAEIAAVSAAITDLTAQLNREAISDDEFDAKLALLRARKADLKALPAEPDTIEQIPTGKTIREHWQGLDVLGKRAWLIERGWKVDAQRGADGLTVSLDYCGDLHDDIEALGGPTCPKVWLEDLDRWFTDHPDVGRPPGI